MSKIVPPFSTTTPLAEIVANAQPGVVFFHNHNHKGSFQILIESMEEFAKSGVKHFYLELSQDLFKNCLKNHFELRESSLESLNKALSNMSSPEQRENLSQLIKAAHRVGVQVLAVDCNSALVDGSRLANDAKAAQNVIKARLSGDTKMANVMKRHISTLSENQKYIGLFGGNHIAICNSKNLNALSVYLHSQAIEQSDCTHINYSPSEIEGVDERTSKHIKQFDIWTMVPPELNDELDLGKEVNSVSLLYLNRLLEKLLLPLICKAYSRKNSGKIDAIVEIDRDIASNVWGNVMDKMDPFAKRMESIGDAERQRIIFENIDQEETRQKLISSLRSLANKK